MLGLAGADELSDLGHDQRGIEFGHPFPAVVVNGIGDEHMTDAVVVHDDRSILEPASELDALLLVFEPNGEGSQGHAIM